MISHELTCYREYKESIIKMVGLIPAEWATFRIKDMVKLIGNGVTPRGGSEVYSDFGIPFLRSQNVYDDGLRISNVSFISKEIHNEMKSSQLRPNDILINITGASIGRTCMVPIELGEANINQHIAFLRVKQCFDPYYISMFLKSSFFKNYIQFEQSGASKEAFNLRQIASIPLILPTKVEQNQIYRYLNSKTSLIDRKIDLLTQKAVKYGDLKNSLIHETVTKGLDKTVSMKDSGVDWIGDIPEHWEVKPIRDLLENRVDKNIGNMESDYLSLVANIGVIPYAQKGSVGNKKPEDLEKCKMVYPGDFVLNSMNFGIGSFGISRYKGVCSSVYIVMRPQIIESGEYLYRIFQIKPFQTYMSSFGKGIMDIRMAIKWNDLKSIYITYPPIVEQCAIATYLDNKTSQIDLIIQNINNQISKLKELRITLINDVVTGKIKITSIGDEESI